MNVLTCMKNEFIFRVTIHIQNQMNCEKGAVWLNACFVVAVWCSTFLLVYWFLCDKETVIGNISNQGYVGEGIMPMAYVLLTTESGAMSSVLESLKGMDFVKETYMVYGVYDILAVVKAETMDKLREIVTWNLRSLDNVRSTLTMIVVEDEE